MNLSHFELHPRYFLQKSKRSLSCALKEFWGVVYPSNDNQSITWDVRNINNNYNIEPIVSKEQILTARNTIDKIYQKHLVNNFISMVPINMNYGLDSHINKLKYLEHDF